MAPFPLTILIDTREQRPLDFAGYADVRTERATFAEGDYTEKSIATLAAVARKGPKDLEGSMVGEDRERVEREWTRLLVYPHRVLVIEATFDQVMSGSGWSATHPNARLGTLCAWHLRFGLAPIFAGSPAGAAAFVYRWLRLLALAEQERRQEHQGTGLPSRAEWNQLERDALAIDRRAGRAHGGRTEP